MPADVHQQAVRLEGPDHAVGGGPGETGGVHDVGEAASAGFDGVEHVERAIQGADAGLGGRGAALLGDARLAHGDALAVGDTHREANVVVGDRLLPPSEPTCYPPWHLFQIVEQSSK